jgi:hypothetical protein
MMAQWEWAWMNLQTRCFGIHQLPNEVAMCPLLDLVNHTPTQEYTRFFLSPKAVSESMFELQQTKDEWSAFWQNRYELCLGFTRESEYGTLCQDMNQHFDEYLNTRYFNYRPMQLDLNHPVLPLPAPVPLLNQIWDLNNPEIRFGL